MPAGSATDAVPPLTGLPPELPPGGAELVHAAATMETATAATARARYPLCGRPRRNRFIYINPLTPLASLRLAFISAPICVVTSARQRDGAAPAEVPIF